MKHYGIDDDGKYYAILIAGRRVPLDDLERGAFSRRKLAGILATIADTAPGATYVNMGTSVNWPEDEDARIKEGADAIVGVVLAVAIEPSPVKLRATELRERTVAALATLPDALWEHLQARYELATSAPGLFLAPAGWTIAQIFEPSATHTPEGEFRGATGLWTTSGEDFPPGINIDPAALPDELWLAAHYA